MTDKEWWEPAIYRPGDEHYDENNVGFDGGFDSEQWNFLCDHMGDANDVMTAMYKEILRLRRAEEGGESHG